jgi:hypothetical protein
MVIMKSGSMFPDHTAPVLSQAPGDGELGFALTTALIVGSGLLLGGGTIWQFHEKRQEKSDYLECVEKYTSAPYSMPPSEAAMVCSGEAPKGFEWGLNSQTVIVLIASVFGMWFLKDMLTSAVKSKISGKSGGK